MGRPNIEFDYEQFERLCEYHCTLNEIAGIMDVSEDTVERACKKKYKKTFAEVFRLKASKGKMSLRRTQYQMAMNGSVPMAIWLGKNWLKQAERIEHIEEKKNSYEEIDSISDDEPDNQTR